MFSPTFQGITLSRWTLWDMYKPRVAVDIRYLYSI
jgi:hypothetical protein